MSFLWNNLAAAYMAVFVSALAWIYGGMRGDVLGPVMPWLLFFLVEVILFFPQRHRNETSYDARKRCIKAIFKDKLTWVCLGLLVLLAIPFVNNGLCPTCDAKTIASGLSADPPVRFLPFCVSLTHHLNVYYWFAGAMLSVIAAKHCLTRRGKRLLVEMIVWNGVLLAVFGFVENATGAIGPFWQEKAHTAWGPSAFFSTFAYPNMAGDYFTTLFCLAAALWRWRYEEVRKDMIEDREHAGKKRRGLFWRKNVHLIPAAILFFAALNTLSRAAIILVTAAALLFFLHAFVTFLSRMPRAARVKAGTWSLMILGLIVFSAATFAPDDFKRETETIDVRAVADRGKNDVCSKLALAIWKDHLMFGCGGWGFAHLSSVKAQELNVSFGGNLGGVNVHNDYYQILAEHGVVGFGAILAIVAMLLAPVGRAWKATMAILRFTKPKEQPARPVQLFVIPAPVFCILTGAALSLVHAVGDCPFRSAAVFVLFFVSLACLEGYLLKIEMPEEQPEERRHHHHHHHNHGEQSHASR